MLWNPSWTSQHILVHTCRAVSLFSKVVWCRCTQVCSARERLQLHGNVEGHCKPPDGAPKSFIDIILGKNPLKLLKLLWNDGLLPLVTGGNAHECYFRQWVLMCTSCIIPTSCWVYTQSGCSSNNRWQMWNRESNAIKTRKSLLRWTWKNWPLG